MAMCILAREGVSSAVSLHATFSVLKIRIEKKYKLQFG